MSEILAKEESIRRVKWNRSLFNSGGGHKSRNRKKLNFRRNSRVAHKASGSKSLASTSMTKLAWKPDDHVTHGSFFNHCFEVLNEDSGCAQRCNEQYSMIKKLRLHRFALIANSERSFRKCQHSVVNPTQFWSSHTDTNFTRS